ncbi:nitrate- and nitrite sensing domain-containing protein [Streptomonospora nanhaiensis]|uniref:sensor histidine kinase n=1 Tax=Streptomonospora nanhaiensis TaxID=1323731 RepID=UPI001C99E22A|nr:nitrate- and nitrite sensing domain-containing protein [Streptomonospora nanhaiensis]MBX9389843.1 nitrate- and nitrite sensing domain-containing protein [Streptomonospora nanhaiensis]
MGRQGGSERSIRAQLNRIVLIPSITFLVLFAVLSAVLLTQAISLRIATGDGRADIHLYASFVELQRERRLAAVHAAEGTSETLAALRRQAEATDDAVTEVAARADLLAGRGDPDIARAADAYFAELRQRSEIRGRVSAGDLGPSGASTAYTDIVGDGLRLYDLRARRLDDGASATAAADAVRLMRAQEQFARGDTLLSAAIAADSLTPQRQSRFTALVDGMRSRITEAAPALAGEAATAYEDLAGSAEWRRVRALADTVARHQPDAETDPATGEPRATGALPDGLDGWRPAADEVHTGLASLVGAQLGAVVNATDTAGSWLFNLSVGGGIISLFAGTVAYGVASCSAAHLTRRLSRLRADTLLLAREELPRIVRRLADGDPVDLDTELRRLDHGRDEVGQVADAFNIAQRTAVSAAVKEAETRAGVNRVFLAIAHRNQSLVQRQLQLLDRIEREEDDPDLLEDLFHLDHLATRGRRNAENLIILGGAQPGRRWRHPIPLVDILRGAISETEEYTRVKLRAVPDLSLSGAVVADIIHLVAELIENATAFSPPHTLVHIHSEVVPKGVAVEIEDRGLGMSEAGLAAANATLDHAPEFDVMALNRDSRLGLFVVARLAAKHDVRVRLCPSPYGGTRAVVLIPAALVSSAEPRRRRPEPPAAARARPEGDLLAPPVRRGTRRRPEAVTEGGAPAPLPGPAGGEHPADLAATEPVPVAPAAAGPGPEHPGERPALPKRRRQASLAPQLRQAPTAADHPAAADERSPEEIRRIMSAFQAGTLRGRADDDRDPVPADGGAAESDTERRAPRGDDTDTTPLRPTPVGAARQRTAVRPTGVHTGENE